MISNDLARAIDACQRMLLLDAANEEGDPVAAAGWQWLADNGKWPMLHRGKYPPLGWDWEAETETAQQSYRLPEQAIDQFEPFWDGDDAPYRASPSACLAAAALAVGRWLQKPRRYRPHSTLQCGEAVVGDWHDSREAAAAQARSWVGLPVGASMNYVIEEQEA